MNELSEVRHKPHASSSEELSTACLGVIRSGNWFRSAPASLQEALLSMGSLRRRADQEMLFSRGDEPDGLYGLVSGAVRVTGLAPDGREALLTIIEPPHWFGEIGVLDGLPRTHDARCQGPSVVLHVPQGPLLQLLDAQPALWRAIGLLATHKLRTSFMALEECALLSTESRVAARLLTIAQGFGEWTDQTSRMVRVSQLQLASMLALSRQTINQILKGLEAAGVVRTARGGVEIVDVNRLRALAGR